MTVEIRDHSWEDSSGKYRAECYPFINGNPIPSIASCECCKLKNEDESKTCHGWIDDLENAPVFCGPICWKFDLLDSEAALISEALV